MLVQSKTKPSVVPTYTVNMTLDNKCDQGRLLRISMNECSDENPVNVLKVLMVRQTLAANKTGKRCSYEDEPI